MSERVISAGTTILFGEPASPMSQVWVDAIGQVVSQVPAIEEAYLPQCFIEGDTDARQVLVVGVRSKQEIPSAMHTLMEKMKLLLGEGQFIDILPFAVGYVPPAAQVVRCFERPRTENSRERRWWKFW